MLATLVVMTAAGAPAELAAETDASTETRPNIVLFLSDDMGWGQPGFNGGTEVETPNIDRIADEGIKLTQFYAQPVCTATRGALLTGRYPWKNGTEVRVGLRASYGMLTDERTIAEVLRDAGYATWIVGKWHLGQWQQEHLPLQRGFDHHYGHYSGEIHSFRLHRGRNHRGILDWHRNGRPVVESGYSTLLLADEAIQLIERHDPSRPFFLYLPFNAVHNPNLAPQEYIDQYSHLDNPEQRAQFKVMDVAIGQVMDALERKGVLGETLVMFLNDNGGTESAGWNEPYRGKKSGFYEGGIRVPAVMRWMGEIPAGSESDALLHAVDLFPTFAGLAGADIAGGLPLDGLDAWQSIAADAESPRDEIVYALGVIRKGDWKLIEADVDLYDPAPGSVLLYNMEDDPYEQTNQAAGETAKVAELRARLDYHSPFARDGEALEDIPDHPPKVYGAEENAAYGDAAHAAVTQLRRGNPGPSLLRTEAVGTNVTLLYDKALDAASVPSASAFKVVVNPGYNAAQVSSVEVSGSNVILTLAEAVAGGATVGLTYDVPDTGAIRDADSLEAVGVTWVTDAAETAAFTVTAAPEAIAEGESATLTVAISNGVTFAADQAITLAVGGGTAAASDFSLPAATLTLTVGATSVTADIQALDDQEEEADETVIVEATHAGASIGSAIVTITENDGGGTGGTSTGGTSTGGTSTGGTSTGGTSTGGTSTGGTSTGGTSTGGTSTGGTSTGGTSTGGTSTGGTSTGGTSTGGTSTGGTSTGGSSTGGSSSGGGSSGSGSGSGGGGGSANRPPVVEREIPAQTLKAGEVLELDIRLNFYDRDQRALDYTVESADTSVATVEVDGNGVLTILGIARGVTTITVTAADRRDERVSQSFRVTVQGPALVALFPSASDPLGREGFVRVINRSGEAGEVSVEAVDDSGAVLGTVALSIAGNAAAHFNSSDLENGKPEKGLSGGVGSGAGNWRLLLDSELDFEVLSYIRTADGLLTAMHDVAPSVDGEYRVAIFNPGRNPHQVSGLRLVNPGDEDAEVTIEGTDDSGASPASEVSLGIPAGKSVTLTALQLETGGEGLTGALGEGMGKWRLRVRSDRAIVVMSLLESPTGHLTNLSTAPGRGGT